MISYLFCVICIRNLSCAFFLRSPVSARKETNRRNSLSYLCRHGEGSAAVVAGGAAFCAFSSCTIAICTNRTIKFLNSTEVFFRFAAMYTCESPHTNPKTISFSAELPEPLQRNKSSSRTNIV